MKMGKKNEYFCSSMILICCIFFPICYAAGNQKEIVQEILNFCSNNRHKYVAILDQEGVSNFKASSMFLNAMYNVRSQFVKKEILERRKSYHDSESNLDTLIIQKNKNLEFSEILKILNTRKIQKSILVVKENEVEEFKVNTIWLNYDKFKNIFILC